jgi:hypothetical protein
MMIGTGAGLFGSSTSALGDGGRNVIEIFTSTIPVVAFAMIFRNLLRGSSTFSDRAVVIVFLALRFVLGLSSGWTGSLLVIMMVGVFVYVVEKKRIPWAFILIATSYVFFIQAGKTDFRDHYWHSDSDAGRLERITFWLDRSGTMWSEALQDPSGTKARQLIVGTLMRSSLLTQSANVLELTPSQVPFQYGRLYSYLAVSWIPRFVWQNKPSVNEANQFYQVAYGLTNPGQLDSVSIAVGTMTEGYISFGWTGVFFIMFLEGVLFDAFRRVFLAPSSGTLLLGIGVVLSLEFLAIEAQLSQYIGGMLQKLLLTFIVFLPVIRLKRPSLHGPRPGTAIHPALLHAPALANPAGK